MHISFFSDILTNHWLAIVITSIGALIYCAIVMRYGKVRLQQSITLFFTGIIVITCIFLPFNWSIQHSGTEKEVSIFFFNLNIEGSNFIRRFQEFLVNFHIEQKDIMSATTFFLAFLEELAKLTLLILCIRKSLRIPIILVYLFVAGTFYRQMVQGGNSEAVLLGTGIILCVVLVILWWLLGAQIRTESVADYIFAVALVALGFAFAENIKYIVDLSVRTGSHEIVLNNAILRSIFGYLSHTFFSMVCVAIYARGRFAFLRMIDNAGNLTLGQKALGWKSFTKLKSIEGFWIGVIVASIIHGVYNIYIGQNVLIPSIILIVGFLFLEFFVLHDLRNNTKYGHIENYMN